MVSSLYNPESAKRPNFSIFFDIVNVFNAVQDSKAQFSITLTFSGIVKLSISQPKNASLHMVVSVLGKTISFKRRQLANAFELIVTIPSGIITLVITLFDRNWC